VRHDAGDAAAREDEEQADRRDRDSDRRFNPHVPPAWDEERREKVAIEPGLICEQSCADKREANKEDEAGEPRSHEDECMLIPGGGGLQW